MNPSQKSNNPKGLEHPRIAGWRSADSTTCSPKCKDPVQIELSRWWREDDVDLLWADKIIEIKKRFWGKNLLVNA